MRNKVLLWCREQKLFQAGDTVICAVSGGADSVAMLHLLLSLQEALGVTVRAAHYNHRLRGAESDRDEAFVQELCRTWNVPLEVSGGDVAERAARTGESIEEAARVMRYAWLEGLHGSVATAHNADDNLETVLLNLLRGTALRGLCGIPPKRGAIVRPLLCLTRQEIETYLQENGLPHVEDSSNETDEHLRNRLRRQILPLLRQENPALSRTVLRSCEILRGDEVYLHEIAENALKKAKTPEGWTVETLKFLPEGVRTRALRLWLAQGGVKKPAQTHVQAVDGLLLSENPSGKVSLPGGKLAAREYGLLVLRAAAELDAFAPVVLDPAGETEAPELGLRIVSGRENTLKNSAEIPDSASTFVVKCGMMDLELPLVLRPRQQGDALRLPGGRRSLKKLLIDRKIPAAKRGWVPVLADGRGVLAVYGLGVNLDRVARPGDEAIVIHIIKMEKEGKSRYD